VPLVIVYPDLANWLISAHADWDQIAHELNTNKPTITGLHLREVDINQPKTLTPHGDDPWQFLTIPISIICETDN
jgi:L-ribulose-5-phosphate 3-epimerase UlaE